MKTIVIAFDGSECSAAIPIELRHAGLPQKVDAHVVTVAESWAPLPESAVRLPLPAMVLAAPSVQAARAEAMADANALAASGAAQLLADFPAWTVVEAGLVGSVAGAIVQRARDVSANAIFIGSQSRSTVARFFLGSVSQKVAAEARCSVRICRPRPLSGAAPRLLVALDGSDSSDAAVRAVAERAWPAGTKVAVVNVVEPSLRAGLSRLPEDLADEIRRQHEARIAWLEAVGIAAASQLETAGLSSERHSLVGEPKSTLLEWAESWNADCLFVGASGLHRTSPDTLGTVASALAVRASCSVEIARP